MPIGVYEHHPNQGFQKHNIWGIQKGYKFPKEIIERRSEKIRGRHLIHSGSFKPREEHWNWKGGISSENKRIRASFEYKQWRKAVFKRDDWTCWICEEKGGKIYPHHFKSFANFPELRFNINNGIVLCKFCHRIYGYHRKGVLDET